MSKGLRLLQSANHVRVNAPRIKGMRATRIASEEGAYHPFVALHIDATHQKSWAIFVQVIADLYGCAVRVGEIPAKPLVWCVASHGCTHPPYGVGANLKRYKRVVL